MTRTNQDTHAALTRLRSLDELADLFAPEGSTYIDPLFGAFYGQDAIRAWIVPVMSMIPNVAFTPTAPAAFADHGDGTATSVDEWVMEATMDDGRVVQMARGCSVRRYRDGWIVYNADHYDTWSSRSAAIEDGGADGALSTEMLAGFGGVLDFGEQLARERALFA
jgi:hypothetical protein